MWDCPLSKIKIKYCFFTVWRQSQERKKNAAKKSADEKKDDSSNKSKPGTLSNKPSANKTQESRSEDETEVVEIEDSKDDNKENEDEDDSDDIQEIPISWSKKIQMWYQKSILPLLFHFDNSPFLTHLIYIAR